VGQHLVQRFPAGQPGDANAGPSGGQRALFHRLARGEAGGLLQLDKSADGRSRHAGAAAGCKADCATVNFFHEESKQ
jgi:hypothetical protein